MSPPHSRRLVLLVPIAPVGTGNGLAMRAELFRRAAAQDFDVTTVVVPVAGRVPLQPQPAVMAVHLDASRARAGAAALLKSPDWRARLSRASPLPRLARIASPGLADDVAAACGGAEVAGLHVMRSYLAPLGLGLAERIGPHWMTLDLDDDDAGLAAASGDNETARAYRRLLDTFASAFDGLAAASSAEARTLSRRHRLDVEHLTNAVDLPVITDRPQPGRNDHVSLLFVGNLLYPPNVEAARILVEAIAPRARRLLGCPVRVTLVGRYGGELGRLAGPDVALSGPVADLAPFYASADAVVVPLKLGGGTRIKLLEAFAYGVPVIASEAAARGLGVVDGRHLLLADDPDQAAEAIAMTIRDPAQAARRAEEARRLVAARYSMERVIDEVREFFLCAQRRAAARRQPAAAS